jgi:hypothetical protein
MMRKIHTVFHLMLYLLISFSFGNNAPTNALGREVFPNTPKSDASLPDTASKALLRQIDEACEKREEGKTNADYGANRVHKAVGKKAGRRKPEGRGEREKEEDELRAKQRAVLDRTALWK